MYGLFVTDLRRIRVLFSNKHCVVMRKCNTKIIVADSEKLLRFLSNELAQGDKVLLTRGTALTSFMRLLVTENTMTKALDFNGDAMDIHDEHRNIKDHLLI